MPSLYLLVVAEVVDVSKVGSQVVMPMGWRVVRKLPMCLLKLAVVSHAAWLWILVVDVSQLA